MECPHLYYFLELNQVANISVNLSQCYKEKHKAHHALPNPYKYCIAKNGGEANIVAYMKSLRANSFYSEMYLIFKDDLQRGKW